MTFPAQAHGIVGNRLFPGTLAFDDPAVADEFAVTASILSDPASDGTDVTDTVISWSFMRLLTQDLAIGSNGGWINRNRDAGTMSGFDQTSLTLKKLLYKSEEHEIMLSAALTWHIGGSGSMWVDANKPNAIQPGVFFGKGFGDLPDAFAWLRPFAITGAITAELPTRSASTELGINPISSRLGPTLFPDVDKIHWGFSVQYSTLYSIKNLKVGRPEEEPLNQFVPMIEFAFVSPLDQKTAATMNPGVAYVQKTYQVALEAVVPLNNEAGHGIGARAQLLLFLDDLLPSVFGKPLFSR